MVLGGIFDGASPTSSRYSGPPDSKSRVFRPSSRLRRSPADRTDFRQNVIDRTGGALPPLFRLVRQGFLKARWGTSDNNRRAKFYELTSGGRKRLREEAEGWNRLASAVACVLSAQPEEV